MSPELNRGRSLPPVQDLDAGRARSQFEYLAMDDVGRELRGTILAADDVEAVAKLKKQGLFPIEVWRNRGSGTDDAPKKKRATPPPKRREDIARVSADAKAGRLAKALGLGPIIKVKHLCVVTRQLSTMLDAGLPLLLSLRTLCEQCGRSVFARPQKMVLSDLVVKVESGMSFSEALSFHPKTFTRLYVGLIRAGEASGAMEEVLQRLAEYMEKNERMKKKVKAGMTYPVVVLIIAIAITMGLMIGVVPQFAAMFDEILEGVPLPLITKVVMAISAVLKNYFLYLFGAVVVMVISLRLLLNMPSCRYAFHWFLISAPPLNVLVRKLAVGRFCGTLGTLLDAGVPILDALHIVRESATNELLRRAIERVYISVSEGEKMARPLEDVVIFPKMVVRMIDVGEQTGALPDMLKRIARTYEEEVEMALEALVSLIEPFMICFLAVIVGGIVLALFLPLIKIIETLGV